MGKKEPALNYVDHADGTLMYLVLEDDVLPWVAEDIYDVLGRLSVDELEDTDFLLITPDGPVVEVEFACTDDNENDFEVTLINPDGTQGELVERVENMNRFPANTHIQHYNGFDKSKYYVYEDN